MAVFRRNSARGCLLAAWRERFAQMLPEIEHRARRAFDGVGTRRLEKLVDEVREHAFQLFVCLARRDKLDIAYARPLAHSAIQQVRTARRLPGAVVF